MAGCRFLLFREGLDAYLEIICGNGRIQTWLGDMGMGSYRAGRNLWEEQDLSQLSQLIVDRKIISFRIKIISRFALCCLQGKLRCLLRLKEGISASKTSLDK